MFKKSLIAVASLLAAVGTAQACSTLVIGKAVSETGNIIVAHNEDNGGRLFNMQHYVPPAKHKKGEMLKFENPKSRTGWLYNQPVPYFLRVAAR